MKFLKVYRPDPVTAFRWVLIGGFLLMLGANMPGQLSMDSVMQLYDGRHHERGTWAPAAYSAVLGAFDSIVPGAGLYVVASGLLLFGTLMALRTLRPTLSWLAPVVALLVVLSPGLLIYQGIVWKDVAFANLAVASFVLLAHIAKVWGRPGRPWLALLGVLLMLALAAQVRQNGLVAAGVAAIVMAWTVREGGWKAVLGWSVGGLISVILVSHAMGVLALPRSVAKDDGNHHGVRLIQQYDIVGTLAHDKAIRLGDIEAADPLVAKIVRTRAVPLYTPERVDYMDFDPAVRDALWRLSDNVVNEQWLHLIKKHPAAYLAHRWDVFRWVFFTPMIDSCLPIWVGVDGPPAKLADLKIPQVVDPDDQSLYNYGTWFFDTPVFSHLSYALVCAATAILLLLRREPQDVAIAGLMIAALGFASTFFLISIACDYRYLYFVDLAAMAGLIYLAIDPPLGALGRRRPR